MPERYAAFLSYARRYRPWVEVLRHNLEAGLAVAGRPGEVFLDALDLGSDSSWVEQLQEKVAQSRRFVLVATPEALASTRVTDEKEAFITRHRYWKKRFYVVDLVEAPLPPFLEGIQRVDFRDAGPAKYRSSFQKLLAGLLRRDPRDPPELPDGLGIPDKPAPGLPAALRGRLVTALGRVKPSQRLAVATRLDLAREILDGPTPECAASALLVEATGDGAPEAGALRVVDSLAATLRDDGEPARAAELAELRAAILERQRVQPAGDLLSIWLRQVAADHAQLSALFQEPYPALDLLQRVYVELQLSAETAGLAVGERESLREPKELLEILRLDPAAEPWITRRWVVLGDPGAGKTTLLRHFAASLAREESPPWVPLFDSLPRLLRERDDVFAAAGRRMNLLRHPGAELEALLERLAKEGRLVLLLDGLDEVPREKRQEAEQLLRGLAEKWKATPLVVASRPIGYRRPGAAFRELNLLPLDRERRREFLALWLGRATGSRDERGAETALAALDRPDLRELAENPLYLTLMALLLEHDSAPSRNRAKLYDQIFALLLDGKHHWPEGEPFEAQATVRAVLRYLAYDMTEENSIAEPVAEIEERLRRPAVAALRRTLVEQWGRLRTFLEELARRTGILGPHDGREADWRFWHRTFREALAAERLAEEYRGKKGKEALLARARAITAADDLNRWAEPFALLVGRVEAPDELVRGLVAANRPLGLRAVATAQNLRSETLREVLALTEDWEERRKVYERLPELVGEPGRALRLLDQLRQQTRNGNDLFFLDQAVQEVGRRSPDHEREADQLRARLYDHIPKPPEELFRWIDTRDGRVELWREIPAGRFWMGSRKGEGDESERPRHEVTIARPFCCAAVPVTQAQYAAFDDRPFMKWQGVAEAELRQHPVVGVTSYEAVSFCRWLAASLPWARGARLPLEEEWEYACRAGTESRYWSGNEEEDLKRVGWYEANSGRRTHRVGEKPANLWGLYDVHGNVWEWTLSDWTGDYRGREAGVTLDPSAVKADTAATEPPGGAGRVVRGGCCWRDADWARAAYRDFRRPWVGGGDQGFRVALPPAPSSLAVDHRS
jgi:formylglycine-generating enzyme required for sulfatase activity